MGNIGQVRKISNVGAVGHSSNKLAMLCHKRWQHKGNIGKVHKISNVGAIGHSSDKGNIVKVRKIRNVAEAAEGSSVWGSNRHPQA